MAGIRIKDGIYFSVEDAASQLNLTVGRIRQMIRWGEIKAIKISERAWIVPASEVEDARKQRRSKMPS